MKPEDVKSLNPSEVHREDLFQVKGKTAVVTGGGRGIGLMMAAALVDNGCDVVILAGREKETLDMAAEALLTRFKKAQGSAAASAALPLVVGISANLSSVAGVKALANEVGAILRERRKDGVAALDILINNAGATWGAPIEEFPESGWDKIMDLNLKAPFFLTQALIPVLEKSERGASVINVASTAAYETMQIGTFSYAASKAGINHLTKMMARHLAEKHVRVNSICPGAVHTKMMHGTIEGSGGDAEFAATLPLKRLGLPGDLAAVTLLFAGRGGEWMTGSSLVLDGGSLIGSRL